MEKIILRDKTEITINTMTEYRIEVPGTIDDVDDIYKKLTESNLEEFKLVNEMDAVLAVFKNKAVVSCTFRDDVITFELRDVDMVEKRLSNLESDITNVQMAMTEIYEMEV